LKCGDETGHHRANYGDSAIPRHGNSRAGGSIAAPVGDTFVERTRNAFDSDGSFFYAVASGLADLYTFNTLEEVARFAKGKIAALMAIEHSINTNRAHATESLKMTLIAVPNPGRRRKRA
jgi:hypothetical protein